MKIFVACFLTVCVLSVSLNADTNTSVNHRPFGFGAFGLGEQVTWLRTNATVHTSQGDEALKLETTNQGITYFTGSMVKLTDKFSAYIHVASTLIANESDARVSSNIQHSDAQISYLLTDAGITLLYEQSAYQAWLFGGNYEYEAIRYFPDNNDYRDNVTIEDDVSVLTLEIGYMVRNKDITGGKGWHFRLGGLIGLPFFNYQATSSSYVVGDEQHYGFNTGVSARAFSYLGYAVIEGLEIGIDVNYLYRFRNVNYSFKYNDPIRGEYEMMTKSTSVNRLIYLLSAAYNF